MRVIAFTAVSALAALARAAGTQTGNTGRGAVTGGVAGASSDRNTDAAGYGPNGGALVYDGSAYRYDDVDRCSGRTYWANGD